MKSQLRFWAPLFILAAQSGCWAFVWITFYSGEMPRQIYWKGHLLVASVYLMIFFVVGGFYGGMRIGRQRFSDVALSGWISLFLTNTVTWTQTCLIGTKVVTPVPILIMLVFQLVIEWIWAYIADRLYIRAVPPHQMILLHGGGERAESLTLKLLTRAEKYRVRESVDMSHMDFDAVLPSVMRYETVVFCGLQTDLHRKLQEFCFKNSIRAYTAPGIGDILTRAAEAIDLFDTPLLLNRNHGLGDDERFVKRICDVVISLLLIITFSPVMLVTALAVKICDGGPVFYSQERLTQGGRKFMLYKFRSMKVQAEQNGARLSSVGDDRITPVGKIIRAIRFDELPQFVNILKGDMSLVGPRPERPELAEEYRKTMPEFDYRLKVKSGLTGYAQVYGSYNTEPGDKLLMDLIYISGYSLILDFKIMLMTVKTLFQKERTEGITRSK